ncbi:MAG: uroporphyrinogen decarboxylase family protein [Saccharofermentanales bacterium]
MKKKERVIRTIRHESTEIMPFQLDLTQGVYEKLAGFYGDADFLYDIVGNHLIREKHKNHKYLDSSHYRDIFGVTWDKEQHGGDIGTIRDYIFKEPDNDLFEFPTPDPEFIKRKCEDIVNRHPDLFKIYEISFSLYERAWTLRGIDNLLMDFVLNKKFVEKLFDKILDYNLKVIDIAAQYPIDCIMFGDDWGQQKGLIMGPAYWDEYIGPRLSEMYARVKKHGLYICQHSCGDNIELFERLIDMGLDIYNTFQPEIYDAVQFKKMYGNDLTIYGGISTQCVLAHGKPDEVREETKKMMDVLGRNGGYIVAPTHQITSDIPFDNILAFIETVKAQ